MSNASVLNINTGAIQKILYEHRVHEIGKYIVHIQKFDIPHQLHFVPPIYHSPQFRTLFEMINSLTMDGKNLAENQVELLLKTQHEHTQIILRQNDQVLISLFLSEVQYPNMIKALTAGGMEEIISYHRELTLYFHHPLETLYSLCDWHAWGSYLYVNAPSEDILIQALALIEISMNQTVHLSYQEVCLHYHLPVI